MWVITQAWLKGAVLKTARGFTARGGSNPSSPATNRKFIDYIAEWSSLAARRAHNPKVTGSSPVSATSGSVVKWLIRLPVTEKNAGSIPVWTAIGLVAQ